ncbi:alpha/beta hydrolase [Gracilibacillus sp. S3-1-1]|uniref:Alpha/beta hydrolase n=1 Tax=Gracilibacillus pellucidus TaxID=3095368 RepID=A0ACC6M0G3_9BACI|nr:alpha/beta hydrolase [Gracilibacillus sp. S3-1-1]MDX8044437.1 alpha/beta hydrolase [Gracilibacillus sp. S3-1-1]
MKVTIIMIVVVLILGGAYFGVGNYFYNFALNAKQEKSFIADNPHLEKSEAVMADIAQQEKNSDNEFREHVSSSDVWMTSTDQLQLHANVYEQAEQEEKWAIVVHGYGGQASEMVRWIRGFYEKGYNVLAPDLRGHGESEGNYIGMGWDDRLDVLAWIDEITEKNPHAEIALFGISMGAATVMMTSGEELPDNVKVIVEDCGYSSVDAIFTYQLADLFNLPKFPVLNAANAVTKLRAGFDLNKASAVNQVKKNNVPMLFIHGEDDSFVPFEMLDTVYNAADVDKEKLIIPGAGHGEAVQVDPNLYWSTVWGFVDRYIG